MTALARRFLPLAVLAALAPALSARAAGYDVAGVAVEIPVPAGYDAVPPVAPFAAAAAATLPEDATMLAAFAPEGFFATHPADARPDSFLVATFRPAQADRTVSPEIMAAAKDATERELAPYLREGGPPAPLGVYTDFRIRTIEAAGPRGVAWIGVGIVPPGGENGPGWREAYGGSVVYANGRLVNLVIRATKLDDAGAGLEAAHRTLLEWTAAVAEANPDVPEDRGFWESTPVRVVAGVALAAILLLVAAALRRRRPRRA
jgi:hypothetical protein